MRDYGIVSPRFWMGETGKAIRQRGVEAQLVGLYLLTSPHANMLGLYYCPAVFISHETGLPLEGALKGLRSLQEAGFCQYDTASEYVYIPQMARFQIAESLKPSDNRVVGINKEYAALANNPFLKDFYLKYKDAFHLAEARGMEAPSKPLRSQEQEQDQEQDQDTTSPPAGVREDDHAPLPEIPELLSHLVNFFTRKGFKREQVQTTKLVPIFKDWIARRIPFALIEEACAIAEAKNSHIGTAAFYVPFVEELIVTSSQPRASPPSRPARKQSQNQKFNGFDHINQNRKQPNGQHAGNVFDGEYRSVEPDQ